jgi:hypothetical protein
MQVLNGDDTRDTGRQRGGGGDHGGGGGGGEGGGGINSSDSNDAHGRDSDRQTQTGGQGERHTDMPTCKQDVGEVVLRFGGVEEGSSSAGDNAHAGGSTEDEEDPLELAARACLKAREVKQYLLAAQECVGAKERAVVGAEVLLQERAREIDVLKQEVDALQHQVDALKHAVEAVCPRVCTYACAPCMYTCVCAPCMYTYARVPCMYTCACAFVLYVVCLSGVSEGHTHTTHTHTHAHIRT